MMVLLLLMLPSLFIFVKNYTEKNYLIKNIWRARLRPFESLFVGRDATANGACLYVRL